MHENYVVNQSRLNLKTNKQTVLWRCKLESGGLQQRINARLETSFLVIVYIDT